MIVYWILLILIIITLTFPVVKHTENTSTIKLIISFILIFIYGAIRVDYGADYEGYKLSYEYMQDQIGLDPNHHIEIGFQIICKILPSYRSLIILLTSLVCCSYFFLFKDYIYPKYRMFSFILLFLLTHAFIGQLSGLRNAIPINLLMLSIPLLKNRKLVLFFGLMLFASFFHTSAPMILPFYFILTPKPLSKGGAYILMFAAVFYIVFSNIFMASLIYTIIGEWFSRYLLYMDGNVSQSSIISHLYFLMLLAFSAYALNQEKNGSKLIIIKLMICYFFINFTVTIGLSERLFFYFAPFLVVGFSIVIENLKNKVVKMVYISLVFLYFAYRFFEWTSGETYIFYENYKHIFM